MNETYTHCITRLREINVITSAGQLNKQARNMLESRYPSLLSDIMRLTSFLTYDAPVRDRLFCITNFITAQPTCKTCGAGLKFNQQRNRFNEYCPNVRGSSCSMGDASKRAQIASTTQQRHGVTNTFHSPEIQEVRTASMLRKYGVAVPAQREANRHKLIEFVRSNPEQSNRKKQQTSVLKYGRSHHQQTKLSDEAYKILTSKDRLEDMLKDGSKTDLAAYLDVSFQTVHQACKRLDIEYAPPKSSGSSQQQSITSFILQSYSGEIVQDAKGIIPIYDLDVYLPDIKLGVEYNGVYFHGESRGRGKQYHLGKLQLCEQVGVRLIQIWSNEWLYKKDIVKSRISSALGCTKKIYARECEVHSIPTSLEREFLKQSHIQGYVPSSINYALMHEGALVALMTFGPSRYNTRFKWELLRYSCAPGVTVVGGPSRLFSAFVRNQSPESVISYCDLRWGTGAMYTQIGFNAIGRSTPNYFYFNTNGDTNKIYSRHVYQKHKLKDKLPLFDPTQTEWLNMANNGYDRIWDCGNSVYGWSKT